MKTGSNNEKAKQGHPPLSIRRAGRIPTSRQKHARPHPFRGRRC
nr:MAG TPA: hypothetical protein [Caudoviricetes sp.]